MEPMSRLSRWLVHTFIGIPDDEEAPCPRCRELVAAGEGLRGNGRVYCSETCSDEHWSNQQV